MAPKVPTLYEWLGGSEVLTRLIDRFYQKVPVDPLLEPEAPSPAENTKA